VDNDRVLLRDNGSANGTFVNGVLSKSKKLQPGDRISVGEYVLELSQPSARAQSRVPVPLSGLGNVLEFPSTSERSRALRPAPPAPALPAPGIGGFGALPGMGAPAPADPARQMPKDLKGKIAHLFEHRLMPFFYGLNLKHDWKYIGLSLGAAFILGNLVLSIYPLLEDNRDRIVREAGKRAQFMAKQIVERNAANLAAGAETKLEIGPAIEKDPSVRAAVLVDMSLRIIAPPDKVGQYFTHGGEARFAVLARDAYRRGAAPTGIARPVDDSIVGLEPVEVYNRQIAKNEVVGMAIVAVDGGLSTLDMGEMGMIYARSLVLTGLLGGLLMLIFYRVTLKPFEELNDDIDRVLKGDMPAVTHEFKFEELNQLWDVINSALQRVPKNDAPGGLGAVDLGAGGGGAGIEEFVGAAQLLGEVSRYGMVVCDADRKVLYVNPMFDDIAGIRQDGAQGQPLSEVSRDQAFSSLITDLFDRVAPGHTITEDFDFSGMAYKVYATAVGQPGQAAKGYVLAAVRNEE
jgi:PAS domain-containing protein